MKIIYCFVLIVFTLLTGCNSRAKQAAADKESYQKATEMLQQKETKNPVAFLKVGSSDKHNIIGQTVIKGNINNNAKMCTYKDVELELSFFSKTGALLQKEKETIYDLISPGSSAGFKTKYFAPKGTDSVAIKIISAKVKQ